MEVQFETKFENLLLNKRAEEVFEKEFEEFKNFIGEEEFSKFKYSISYSLSSNNLALKKIEKSKILYEKLKKNDYTIDIPSLMNIILYNSAYNKKHNESYLSSSTTLGSLYRNKDTNNNQLPLIISAGSNS